jgi:lipopolysaccharide/colanic/teichoic acid biosynthesis glycosyltransferase
VIAGEKMPPAEKIVSIFEPHYHFEGMIIMDLYYVYNRSLQLDFRILCQTLGVVLNGKGAYWICLSRRL